MSERLWVMTAVLAVGIGALLLKTDNIQRDIYLLDQKTKSHLECKP